MKTHFWMKMWTEIQHTSRKIRAQTTSTQSHGFFQERVQFVHFVNRSFDPSSVSGSFFNFLPKRGNTVGMQGKIAKRLTHHLRDDQWSTMGCTRWNVYLNHRTDCKIVHKKDMRYQFINQRLRPYITASKPGDHVILVSMSWKDQANKNITYR